MNLLLQRHRSTHSCTHGDLYIDGVWECVTLEDVVRDVKEYGKTAIPAGRYTVSLTYSEHFQRVLPLIGGVRGFEGIRIHSGNTSRDTEGCILVGKARPSEDSDWISRSAAALLPLLQKLKRATEAKEKIEILIKDAPDRVVTKGGSNGVLGKNVGLAEGVRIERP